MANQSSSWEDATKVVSREQNTQSDMDDRKSLDENALASESDWESETENSKHEQDEVVQVSRKFHKEEVKKVEPRKSDLGRAKIDPRMKDIKEIRRQMVQTELSADDLRQHVSVIRQVHIAKQMTKSNGDAFGVIRESEKKGAALQWPDERRVW